MNAPSVELLLIANCAATMGMVGVIWFVQIVHYPLFASVGAQQFPEYERRHSARITWIVAPLMLIEAAASGLLCLATERPVPAWMPWTGAALLGVIWLSTALVQVPCHSRLARGFDPLAHRRLVRTNWLRTIAWSLRGVLALWMLWLALDR